MSERSISVASGLSHTVQPENTYAALGGIEDRTHALDQSRLACPVRADDAEQLTPCDGEIDTLQSPVVLEASCEPEDLNTRLVRCGGTALR